MCTRHATRSDTRSASTPAEMGGGNQESVDELQDDKVVGEVGEHEMNKYLVDEYHYILFSLHAFQIWYVFLK